MTTGCPQWDIKKYSLVIDVACSMLKVKSLVSLFKLLMGVTRLFHRYACKFGYCCYKTHKFNPLKMSLLENLSCIEWAVIKYSLVTDVACSLLKVKILEERVKMIDGHD